LPPLLTVGAGGTATEIWRDVLTVPLPISRDEVREVLMQLRCAALLRGYRGRPAYDIGATVDAVISLVRAAQLVGPRLVELEVNPLIVQTAGGGASAADVLFRLAPQGMNTHA
jgi:hypothetical protein